MCTMSNIDRLAKLPRQQDPVRRARCIVDQPRAEINMQYLNPLQLNERPNGNGPANS